MLRRVVWLKFADVSEVLSASVMRIHRPDDGGSKASETLVNFYQTTRRNIPENSHLHNRRSENLKSQLIN
jgi:hypothetical protein